MDNIHRRTTAPSFFNVTALACILAAAFAFGQEAEPRLQKKMKLGVLNLEASAKQSKLASEMSVVMTDKLDSMGLYELYLSNDIDEALAAAGIRKPDRCRDPKCVQDVAAALGLDRMIYGTVYMDGARCGVNIVLIDVSYREPMESVSVEGAEGVPAKHVIQCALDRAHGYESQAYVSKYFDTEINNSGEMIWSSVAVQGVWALYSVINYGVGGAKGVELPDSSRSNRIPIFARPSALANACAAASDDAYGVFCNPAGMPFVMKREAALAYQYQAEADVLAASYVNMATRNTGFGQAFLISTDRESLNTELYFVSAAGYRFDGMPVLGPLSLGASVKTTGGTMNDVPRNSPLGLSFGGGLDLGLMWELSQSLRYGAVMRDVISVNRWKNENYRYTERLPPSLRMGGSYRAGHTLLLAADGQIPLYEYQPWVTAGGVEYEFSGGFALRTGLRREFIKKEPDRYKITSGAGLKLNVEPIWGRYLTLDLAHEYNLPDDVQVINVSMRLGF